MPSDFAYLAGGTGGGAAGEYVEGCPAPPAGGVTTPFSLPRSITVNGVQHTFQQTGSIYVGWCYDVLTIDSATVAVDTGQGILTVIVGGSTPTLSEGPTTVNLTSPAPGATYTAPATVPLSATAAVTIGAVSKVEFYRDATLVATVLSPPYTASDTGVAVGSYSYTAVAYNDEDPNTNALVSFAANVTVNAAAAQSSLYYIHTDHLNTPRLITNQAQQAVWRWDQAEPFGTYPANENPSALGAFEFNLRFPGQYFDKGTNTHYSYFRDCYDPAIGRFCQSDPIGLAGGINSYAYAGSNSMSVADPSGLWSSEAHDWFINQAYGSLPSDVRSFIMRGSAFADYPQFQGENFAYMHAMSSDTLSPEVAERLMYNYVTSRITEFQTLICQAQSAPNLPLQRGLSRRAYFELGMGLHAVMDSTSPAHRGFQHWPNGYLKHGGISPESLEDVDTAKRFMNETVGLMRQWFTPGSFSCNNMCSAK